MSHRKILFANIGWMISYNGITDSDEISGAGSYPDVDKHEIYNFQNLNGNCYGYIQASSINLQRIDPTTDNEADKLEDVLVVWFAPNKTFGGSWIVGWYSHATVYRHIQKSSNEARQKYSYYVVAKFDDCTLLPVDERTKQIPRRKFYPGRYHTWFADTPEVQDFRKMVIRYIETYTPAVMPRRSMTFHSVSIEARSRIEKAAVEIVKNIYIRRGYSITDVQNEDKGWDLEALNGERRLLLEVKGQGNHDPYVRITRKEYEMMRKNRKMYRLCVVINAVDSPRVYIFINKSGNTWVLEDNDQKVLEIDEQVFATATFQV